MGDKHTTGTPDVRLLAGELLSRTGWSTQQLREHQRDRLRGLIRHAVASAPYYRRLLGPHAEGEPLRALPTTTKTALMRQWDEIVTDPRLRLDDIRAHLSGTQATQPYHGHVVVSTSGSTGTPAIFVYSPAEMAEAVAGLIRALALIGVGAGTRVLGIGAASAVSLSHHLIKGLPRADDRGRAQQVPSVSVLTPLPELVRALNAYQPEALATVAGVAALLAEEQLAGRLRIAPRLVVTTSEVLAPDMRERIRAAWGIEPHQLYATTEGAVLASTVPASTVPAPTVPASTGRGDDAMRVWEDQVILEVVDANGDPVPPGTPGDKVLLTNLANRVLPLIRYEISDRVTLAGPDPDGSPFNRIAAIDGRADEVIVLSTRDGARVPVHATRLRAPFVRFPDVVQYQIGYDQAGLTVYVVPRPNADADLAGLVHDALIRELETAGILPPPVTVVPVAQIGAGAGAGAGTGNGPSGKRAVIRAQPRQP
jgi:phenylacetate-CoA ligase